MQDNHTLFNELQQISARPKPFEFYTASDLWTDEYTSEQMLKFHLDGSVDLSSRRAEFIERSTNWITARFNIGPTTKIADFGCRPGLYTTRLAQAQSQVTGIDFSLRSLDYARQLADREGLNIHYVHQNYLEFETDERFDLILMIMCDFCALSPEQRSRMLEKFAGLLKPGGSILLDVYSLSAFDRREEFTVFEPNQLNGFWSNKPYYGFLNTFKYAQEKVILDKYTIVEAGRTRTIYNWLQYFDANMLDKEFAEHSLSVDAFYSDVAGTPFDDQSGEFAVVAQKS